MATVGHSKRTHFHNISRAAADDMSEGLSTSRATTSDDHWGNWAAFFREVTLYLLIILYRDPVPILNAFARQYRT